MSISPEDSISPKLFTVCLEEMYTKDCIDRLETLKCGGCGVEYIRTTLALQITLSKHKTNFVI